MQGRVGGGEHYGFLDSVGAALRDVGQAPRQSRRGATMGGGVPVNAARATQRIIKKY